MKKQIMKFGTNGKYYEIKWRIATKMNEIIDKELFEKLYGTAKDLELFIDNNKLDVVSQGILCFSATQKELAQKCKKLLKENGVTVITVFDPNKVEVEINLIKDNFKFVEYSIDEDKVLISLCEELVFRDLI